MVQGLVQSNGEATAKLIGGCTGHGFLPGRSGNPGGKAKGLSRLIRESTDDGAELVRLWLQVMRDEGARWTDRLEAARQLADRGWGKPVETHEIGGLDAGPIAIRLRWGNQHEGAPEA